jgi:integrase/recombinase XerD
MIEQFRASYEKHLRILQGLSPLSVASYSAKLDEFYTWLQEASPAKPITAVTRQDIEAYLEHCFYQGNNNQTRRTKLTAVTKFFRYLRYIGEISEDITQDIPKIKRKRTFVQRFTKAEILRFFAATDIRTEKGLRDACILICAAFAGLRAGEIAALTLQDLIDEGKSLDIHVIGKFEKERQIYLWKAPSDILRRWLSVRLSHGARRSDPLFVSYRRGSRRKEKGITIFSLDYLVKTLAARVSIKKPKISMHMFRAAHTSDLRNVQGYDAAAIAQRLGHANIATTDRYIPTRGRLHRIYPSLSAYWHEFNTIWSNNADSDSPNNGGDTGA